MTIQRKNTRFRAYQLDSAGSSLSYFDGSIFTLIEARLTDENEQRIRSEMAICGISAINTLHITSWDQDHCVPSQLCKILMQFSPVKIEYPGYDPHSESGKESLEIILAYKRSFNSDARLIQMSPQYIESLDKAKDYGYKDIIYHPKTIDPESSNNNSTIKQFRTGSFNVLSLGDVESSHISAGMRSYRSISKEVDIMILAHHGADNGFTTSSFIKAVRPKVAISTSNFGNQHDHPRQEVKDLLRENGVILFTTKSGDIIAESIGSHSGEYKVTNLITNNEKVSAVEKFKSKKMVFLSQNADNIRAQLSKKNRGPR